MNLSFQERPHLRDDFVDLKFVGSGVIPRDNDTRVSSGISQDPSAVGWFP